MSSAVCILFASEGLDTNLKSWTEFNFRDYFYMIKDIFIWYNKHTMPVFFAQASGAVI